MHALMLCLALLIGKPPSPQSLTSADAFYQKAKYLKAYQTYSAALKAGTVPQSRLPEVEYRSAVSLLRIKAGKTSLKAALALLKKYPNTIWEARALVLLGRNYYSVPHTATKIGERYLRELPDAPKKDAQRNWEAEQWAENTDRNLAHQAYEAAHIKYFQLPNQEALRRERILLNFDMLYLGRNGYLREDSGKSEPIDPKQPYNPKWGEPQRVLYLYEQIKQLAREDKAFLAERITAIYGEVMWLLNYQRTAAAEQERIYAENEIAEKPTYPYQDWKPLSLLNEALRTLPADPNVTYLRLLRVDALSRMNRCDEAKTMLKTLQASKLTPEQRGIAKNLQTYLDTKELWWSSTKSRQPDVTIPIQGQTGLISTVTINSRNLNTVQCYLYRIPIKRVLQNGNAMMSYLAKVQLYQNYIPRTTPSTIKKLGFPLLKTWSLNIQQTQSCNLQKTEFRFPTKEAGYYVALVVSGKKSLMLPFHQRGMVLQSISCKEKGIYCLKDASTGRPIPNQTLFVRTGYINDVATFDFNSKPTRKLVTNAQGIATANKASETLLWVVRGQDSAFCDVRSSFEPDSERDIQGFGVTDRAVYRPGQTVYYRIVLAKPTDRICKPIPSQKVSLKVVNPKGNGLETSEKITNEFGSISGEFVIPLRATLGQYEFKVDTPSGRELSVLSFGVEEYKKPEFEVKVTATPQSIRLGETGTFRIQVNYYMGGGVPNAKVRYSIVPENRYYWYFNRNTVKDTSLTEQQGTILTNAKGEATVPYNTAQARNSQQYQWGASVRLMAQVQDASRRIINGEGSLTITPNKQDVSLNTKEQYGVLGTPVQITLKANEREANSPPLGGTVLVQKKGKKDQKTVVARIPVVLTQQNETTLSWTPTQGGEYEITFLYPDNTLSPDRASLYVLGQGLDEESIEGKTLTIRARNHTYETSAPPRFLLITPEKDCWVLLCWADVKRGLMYKTIHLANRATEIELPTPLGADPVTVSASCVLKGKSYQESMLMWLYSETNTAKIQVEADKAIYLPGEKAHLRVKVTDKNGTPLRTEMSLALRDASLQYIAGSDNSNWGSFSITRYEAPSIHNQDSSSIDYRNNYYSDEPYRYSLLPDTLNIIVLQSFYNQKRNSLLTNGFSGKDILAFDADGSLSVNGKGDGVPDSGFTRRVMGRRSMGGGGGMGGGMGGAMMGGGQGAMMGGGIRLNAMTPASANWRLGYQMGARDDTGVEEANTRTKFADLAFWTPTLRTDKNGYAEVTVTMPENLTRWQAFAAGNTVDGLAGEAETNVTTKKNLLVRLQTPRFLTEKDTVAITAIVQNDFDQNLPTQVQLQLEGGDTEYVTGILPHAANSPTLTTTTPAKGEKRIDWVVKVKSPGTLKVHVSALTTKESDATEISLPILVHGIEKAEVKNGVLRGASKASLPFNIPSAHKPGSPRLVLHLSPSLVNIVLDTLPQLADYPYGCVEQTMSRFLPSVIVSKTLTELGYPIEDLQKRAEKLAKEAPTSAAKRDDNPYSYPSATLTTLLPQRERYGWENPVFSEKTLKEMLEAGVQRLDTMKSDEGGWGWWAGQSPDLQMTAYVLNGLVLAKKAGVAVPQELISHGENYLKNHYVQKTDLHLGVAIASALMKENALEGLQAYVRETLFPQREKLSLYGRALLALTLNTMEDKPRVATLLQEITALLEANEKRGSLINPHKEYWEWYNNDTETKATLLEVYSTLQPKSKWAERLVQELLDQRKSRIWDSTRDTALTVMALTHYIRANKELEQEYTLTAKLNGTTKTLVITKENALFDKGEIAFGAEALKNGTQNLTITKNGGGNCYYTAELRYFNDEEPLKPVRGEIRVERRYVRLVPNPNFKPTAEKEDENPFLSPRAAQLELQDDWTVEKKEIQSAMLRMPLYDTTILQSGDQLEVELYIESQNPQQYVLFEDIKPAGCEAVDVNSGLKWDMEREGSYWWYGSSYYQEMRDQKVASFITYLPAGKSVIRYRLQIETPGQFRALPTNAYAMYAPKVNALSEERKINITDTAPFF